MTATTSKPRWEVAHSLGSILWRERAGRTGRYEVRLRERPLEPQRSTYVPGPRTEAAYRAAEEELARRITHTSAGGRTAPRNLTVGAWLDEWLAGLEDVSPSTVTAYTRRTELYLKPVLGRARLAELEPADVTAAMARLGKMRGERTDRLSAGTVDAAYRVLKAALADAWELGKAPRNATRGAKVRRPVVHVEPPTQAELDAVFAELAGDAWLPLFTLIRYTGCRLGEALGLEWRHVDIDARTATFVRHADTSELKTRRSKRTVALALPVLEELRKLDELNAGGRLVFTTRTGRGLDERNVLRHWDAALERAGVAPDASADMSKYRVHDMRHAFATMLLEANVSAERVRAWCGWSSAGILDRYSHVEPITGGDASRRIAAAWHPADVAPAFGIRSAELELLRRSAVA